MGYLVWWYKGEKCRSIRVMSWIFYYLLVPYVVLGTIIYSLVGRREFVVLPIDTPSIRTYTPYIWNINHFNLYLLCY